MSKNHHAYTALYHDALGLLQIYFYQRAWSTWQLVNNFQKPGLAIEHSRHSLEIPLTLLVFDTQVYDYWRTLVHYCCTSSTHGLAAAAAGMGLFQKLLDFLGISGQKVISILYHVV